MKVLLKAAVLALPLWLTALDGAWHVDGAKFVVPGKPKIEVEFPGSAQLYLEPERTKFRPQRPTFEARNLASINAGETGAASAMRRSSTPKPRPGSSRPAS